jgi:hypothetical protein
MGAICGPAIANVVVYKLEKKWLYIHKPLIYRRYIDDICIFDNKLLNLSNFKSVFCSLKLNIVSGLEIQFLDIKIKDRNSSNQLVNLIVPNIQEISQELSASSDNPLAVTNNYIGYLE